eukprot:2592714-Rhodomonas_salina.1
MAAKAIGAVGVAAAGYFAYSMASAPAVEPAAKLTKEQQKTRNLRSHLSGIPTTSLLPWRFMQSPFAPCTKWGIRLLQVVSLLCSPLRTGQIHTVADDLNSTAL